MERHIVVYTTLKHVCINSEDHLEFLGMTLEYRNHLGSHFLAWGNHFIHPNLFMLQNFQALQ